MGKKRLEGGTIHPRASLAGQAADHLRRQIVTRFNPSDPLPSERELGRLLGVSRKTVRKAIEQLCGEGWLARPRGGAPRVAKPPSRPVHTSGLIVPMDANSLLHSRFYRDVTSGLHEAAVANQRSILYLFSLAGHKGDLLSALMGLPNIRMVDSLLTLEVFDETVMAELARLAPVVALDTDCRAAGVSSICFDHEASTQMAFKYLYDLGHRRIGIAIRPLPDVDPAIQARHRGFVQAMQRVGLSLTSDLELRPRFDGVARAAERFLTLPAYRRPTALVATENAWPLIYALTRRGVRIPQDLSIVTIGRREGWMECLDRLWEIENPRRQPSRDEHDRFLCSIPPTMRGLVLTTVELPARRMGRLGMAELIRRLEQPGGECTHQVLPMQLRLGTSTTSR